MSTVEKCDECGVALGFHHEQCSVYLTGEIPPATPLIWPSELTPELREALGLMNFTTGPIAHVYREAGHQIARKIEDEQAFVLHRLVGFVLKHGADWRKFANEDLQAAFAAAKGAKQ